MSEIANVKSNRAIIPAEAESLDINNLDFCDARKHIKCVATYARFKL